MDPSWKKRGFSKNISQKQGLLQLTIPWTSDFSDESGCPHFLKWSQNSGNSRGCVFWPEPGCYQKVCYVTPLPGSVNHGFPLANSLRVYQISRLGVV